MKYTLNWNFKDTKEKIRKWKKSTFSTSVATESEGEQSTLLVPRSALRIRMVSKNKNYFDFIEKRADGYFSNREFRLVRFGQTQMHEMKIPEILSNKKKENKMPFIRY